MASSLDNSDYLYRNNRDHKLITWPIILRLNSHNIPDNFLLSTNEMISLNQETILPVSSMMWFVSLRSM